MKSKTITRIATLLIVTAIGSSGAFAQKKNQKAPETALTEAGQKLEAQYTAQLTALKEDITKALPSVDEKKKAAFTKALETEDAAATQIATAQKGMDQIKKAEGGVAHAKGKWIGGAEKGIQAAQVKLK